MTASLEDRTRPGGPAAPSAAPTGDRRGVLGGIALGAVMIVVALVVALTGGDAPAGGSVVADGGTQTVEVTLSGMTITPSLIEVAPGTELVLEVTNADALRHDLVLATGEATPMLGPGETATIEVGAVTAAVDGWCSVPGHRAAGMTMQIVPAGTDAAADAGADDDVATPADGASGGHASHDAVGGASVTLDPSATPGVDWRPYDPHLAPAPGATEHVERIAVSDVEMEVAPGVTQTVWAFNGTVPGPTLRGKVGDLFTITFVNESEHDHGIDFHAGSRAPDEVMRTIAPGEELTYQFVAEGSGAWLYHCSTMPMSLHMANGMFGAVVIDPPNLAPVDTELVLVKSELYLGPQGGTADEAALLAEEPDAVVFNGYANQYAHSPIQVGVGERIRIWVVDAGPQRPVAFHVVGTQFDTVFKEGAYLLRPGNAEQGRAQVLDLAPAQGGFVEMVLPEPGRYTFVDHAMVDGERGAHGVLEATG